MKKDIEKKEYLNKKEAAKVLGINEKLMTKLTYQERISVH